jgi:AcrR family transcriptional regulator
MIQAHEIDGIPLRQRKAAATRLALLEALLEALGRQGFDQLRVKDLCHRAAISEPTFFKYFPSKVDLLTYFLQLWSIETRCRAEREAPSSGIEYLLVVFDAAAAAWTRHPRLMVEVFAHQLRAAPRLGRRPPSAAELRLRFPALEGTVVERPPLGPDELIQLGLQRALEVRELPGSTNLEAARQAIVALFYGVPSAGARPREIRDAYRRSLHLLWLGLSAVAYEGGLA